MDKAADKTRHTPTGAELIAAERQRQVTEEGWDAEHDDEEHVGNTLAMVAACYAAPEPIFVHREEESSFFSGNTGDRGDRRLREEGYYDPLEYENLQDFNGREKHERLRLLVIAGALIAAEIDRLQRSALGKA